MTHPERLKALRDLTGGNPRTVVALFFLFAEDFSASVLADLENLLDRVTPLYKARIEELSEQQQVIVSAIADHWAPITARAVSETIGLPMGGISAQLDRLEKIGFVERVEIFGQTSGGCQIAERFLNIWFLMRSASRRQRRAVEFLVRFIESFYEAKERPRLAHRMMKERDFSPDRYQFAKALAHTLDTYDKEELSRRAELDILRQKKATEARRRLEQIIDYSTLPPATLAFDELREKLMALVPGDAGVTPERFAEEVLGDRQMFIRGERDRLAATIGKLGKEKIATILQSIRDARELDESKYGAPSVVWFRQRLAMGQLRSLFDWEDWNRSLLKAEERNEVRILVDSIPPQIVSELTQNVRMRILNSLRSQRLDEAEAQASNDWGSDQHYSQDPYAWDNLGDLLRDHLGLYAEAEAAYRKAIEIDQNFAYPWIGLGRLLLDHLGRYSEAEAAFRKAIEIDPRSSDAWDGLGNLYCDHCQKYSDAASAFTKALECGGGESPRQNLVFLYRDFLGDMPAAKQAFALLQADPLCKFGDSYHLQEALFAAYRSNWGLCREALAEAIDVIGQRFPSSSDDDWCRASAVLLHLNYGEELLAFLRERGDDARLRPWYEALSALHRGDRRYLQNIPVEMRATAEYYFDQIEKRLNALPEKTRRRPVPKPPKKRRKA